MGDQLVYKNIVLLRAVKARDFVTAIAYLFSPETLTKPYKRANNDTPSPRHLEASTTSSEEVGE